MVLYPSDLVAGEVEDPEVLQAPEHVRGDQMDEVTIECKLQQLPLAEEGPGLKGRDAVILEVQVMEAAQTSQVLEADLHNGIVLEEDGLTEDKVNGINVYIRETEDVM